MNQTQRLPSLGAFFNEVISTTRNKFFRMYQIFLPAIVVFLAAIVVVMIIMNTYGLLSSGTSVDGSTLVSSLPVLSRILVLIAQIIVALATVISLTAATVDIMDPHFAHLSIPHLYKSVLAKFWPLVVTYIGIALMIAGGLLLFVFPGIILSIITMFALPLVVIGDLDFEKALARSNALTYGYKWGIFGRTFAFGAVIGILFIVAGILGGLLSGIHHILGLVFIVASVAIIIPSVPSSAAVLYKHLTNLQEGESKSVPVKQWVIILFIILGVVYTIISKKMERHQPRSMRSVPMQQELQNQMNEVQNMTPEQMQEMLKNMQQAQTMTTPKTQ